MLVLLLKQLSATGVLVVVLVVLVVSTWVLVISINIEPVPS